MKPAKRANTPRLKRTAVSQPAFIPAICKRNGNYGRIAISGNGKDASYPVRDYPASDYEIGYMT